MTWALSWKWYPFGRTLKRLAAIKSLLVGTSYKCHSIKGTYISGPSIDKILLSSPILTEQLFKMDTFTRTERYTVNRNSTVEDRVRSHSPFFTSFLIFSLTCGPMLGRSEGSTTGNTSSGTLTTFTISS